MDEKQFMDTISSSLKAMLVEVVQNRIKIDALIKLLQDKGLITSEEANEYVSEFINTQYQPLLNEMIGAIDLILKKKT
jgi:polyhydroxyalkanoate synthesis regulator phasin